MKDKGIIRVPEQVLAFEKIVEQKELKGEGLRLSFLYYFPKAKYALPKGKLCKENKGVWEDPGTKFRLLIRKDGGCRLL
jgi:hypothetical protein